MCASLGEDPSAAGTVSYRVCRGWRGTNASLRSRPSSRILASEDQHC